MKKVWARISIEMEVTDEKYNELLGRSDGEFIDLTPEEAEEFVKNGTVSDDSYIPEAGINLW